MNKLQKELIKLSYQNPKIRKHLLPLIISSSSKEQSKEARGVEDFLNLRIKNPETGNKVKIKTLQNKPKDSLAYKEYLRALEQWKKSPQKSQEKQKPSKEKVPSLFTEKERNLPNKSQKERKPEKLFAQAKKAHEEQLDWLNRGKGIDRTIGAEVVRVDSLVKEGGDIPGSIDKALKSGKPVIIIGPPKEQKRSEEKVRTNFNGDWGQLKDIVRASVVVPDFASMDNMVKELKKSGMKLASAPLDRFANPTEAGYRDLKLDVEYEDGHIGELQLHVRPVMEVKEQAHKMYEQVRTIQAKAKEEGRTSLSEEEQKIVDGANKQMKSLYNKAWEQALGKKTASVTQKEAAQRKFYELDGVLAYWEYRQFPVLVHDNKEEVYYDLEDFFHNAVTISRQEFEKRKKERTKTSSLKKELIKLAFKHPKLRKELLPLIKK